MLSQQVGGVSCLQAEPAVPTQTIQSPGAQPCSSTAPRAGFYPKPHWMIWWHCQGAAAAVAKGRLDLLLHHHHLPPPRCSHGTRLVLSPGEGSTELLALQAKEDEEGGTQGRDTEWKPKCDTQAREKNQKRNKRQQQEKHPETKNKNQQQHGVRVAESPARPGFQEWNFLLILEAEEQEAVWITSAAIQVCSPRKIGFGVSGGMWEIFAQILFLGETEIIPAVLRQWGSSQS